jgi:hypothetical protein
VKSGKPARARETLAETNRRDTTAPVVTYGTSRAGYRAASLTSPAACRLTHAVQGCEGPHSFTDSDPLRRIAFEACS